MALGRGKLIGVIGDEDTCVGFLLGGIGELNKNRQPNFMVVDKNTSTSDIEDCLKDFIRRDDIDIILINQSVAELVRHVLDSHTAALPAILEIPSKYYKVTHKERDCKDDLKLLMYVNYEDAPYDPAKDSILRRAKGMYSAEDLK